MHCLQHRTDTGKYDDDVPSSFLYVTNIYWWDGGAQNVPRITRLMASVAVGEEYRNMTSGFVSDQGGLGNIWDRQTQKQAGLRFPLDAAVDSQ
jgi:hypothetical protein